jgi:hypothetical protein
MPHCITWPRFQAVTATRNAETAVPGFAANWLTAYCFMPAIPLSAGSAADWDACRGPALLPEVRGAMEGPRRVDRSIKRFEWSPPVELFAPNLAQWIRRQPARQARRHSAWKRTGMPQSMSASSRWAMPR